MLSPEELERYKRQIILPEVGEEGQERLRSASVLIVGTGGLGCPVALYLAAAGVGTIGLVDDDCVDKSNLQRQILFTTSEAGSPKVEKAAGRLADTNPNIVVNVFHERLSATNAEQIIKDYDIVVDGSDNFGTRYLINDTCVALNKPFVAASIFKFEGQVSVFNLEGGPTYRCLFPEPPAADTVPACSDVGVLGPLAGILGTLQANEVIKVILGIGSPLRGRLFVFNSLTADTKELTFARNDEICNNTRIQDETYYLEMNSCMSEESVKTITPQELKQRIDGGDTPLLLDVREDFEREEFNIGGIHIPLGTLPDNLSKIPKDEQIVVYCRSGGRSEHAALYLTEECNFTDIWNLVGGMTEYKQILEHSSENQ